MDYDEVIDVVLDTVLEKDELVEKGFPGAIGFFDGMVVYILAPYLRSLAIFTTCSHIKSRPSTAKRSLYRSQASRNSESKCRENSSTQAASEIRLSLRCDSTLRTKVEVSSSGFGDMALKRLLTYY